MRLISQEESGRHGCAFCLHKERSRPKYIHGEGYEKSHNYCPFPTCPYADIMDKYKSYLDYINQLEEV